MPIEAIEVFQKVFAQGFVKDHSKMETAQCSVSEIGEKMGKTFPGAKTAPQAGDRRGTGPVLRPPCGGLASALSGYVPLNHLLNLPFPYSTAILGVIHGYTSFSGPF